MVRSEQKMDAARLVLILGISLMGIRTVAVAAESTDGDHSVPSAASDAAGDGTESVWCLDERLSIVTRKSRGRCPGRWVTDEEARRIKEARTRRVQQVFESGGESPFVGKRLASTGTGFFVSTAGHVVTNHHVVDECEAISVIPAGESEVKASMDARDVAHDLALLSTVRAGAAAAVFRPVESLPSGEPLAVVGYPQRGLVTIRPVMVHGSARAGFRSLPGATFAMDMDIRQGNSGGPILDLAGRVVGVVVAAVNTPGIYATTGEVVREVGVGIQSQTVRRFLLDHGVIPKQSKISTPLDDATLFLRARKIVAQIGCWR